MASKWLATFRQAGGDCSDVPPPVPKCQKSQKVISDNSGILAWPTEGSGSPDSLPAGWTEGVSLLGAIARAACIRADRWRYTVIDAERFLQQWGWQAAALGWATIDLFGCHPTNPLERVDLAGLILLLRGDTVVALTADAAHIRTRSEKSLTYYRRPRPGAVPLWQLRRPVDAAAARRIEALSHIVREAKRLFPGATVTVRDTTSDGSATDKTPF